MSLKWKYMPILKWKRGEQFALRFLTAPQWKEITPLVELLSIDAAPDGAALRAALPDYLAGISDTIAKSIFGDGIVLIDTAYVSPGYTKQLDLLLVVCEALKRNLKLTVIPVLRGVHVESIPALSPARLDLLKSQTAIVLRLRSDQIEATQIGPSVAVLTTYGIKKSTIHILVDQFSLVDCAPKQCLTAVTPYIVNALVSKCASVTLGGGSFPMYLTGIPQGTSDIPRVEWRIWELLQKSAEFTELRYADYTVSNPAPLPDVDGQYFNPSIAIRYASSDFWRLFKGGSFKGGKPGEYRNLCKLLITDKTTYSGSGFSYGDGKLYAAANGGTKNGTPWTWRREATSHHIVLTANSL